MVSVLTSFPGTFFPLLFLTRRGEPGDLFKKNRQQKNLKTEPHTASLFLTDWLRTTHGPQTTAWEPPAWWIIKYYTKKKQKCF